MGMIYGYSMEKHGKESMEESMEELDSAIAQSVIGA